MPQQRGSRGLPPRKQLNVRVTDATYRLAERLQGVYSARSHLSRGYTLGDTVERAIREAAKLEGLFRATEPLDEE